MKRHRKHLTTGWLWLAYFILMIILLAWLSYGCSTQRRVTGSEFNYHKKIKFECNG